MPIFIPAEIHPLTITILSIKLYAVFIMEARVPVWKQPSKIGAAEITGRQQETGRRLKET